MDAHYAKVMSARDAINDQSKKLYFAYSGVLDQEAFNQWRVEHSYTFFELPKGRVAKAENLDLVFDFPSRWWGGRVAGLVEKQDSHIYGLLFEITAKNWPVVQHKEGVVTGMSVEKVITVNVEGQNFEAIAFTTAPSRVSLQGTVSEAYLEALIRGAEQSGLPLDYIQSINGKAK